MGCTKKGAKDADSIIFTILPHHLSQPSSSSFFNVESTLKSKISYVCVIAAVILYAISQNYQVHCRISTPSVALMQAM